jgi:hypothetical protein
MRFTPSKHIRLFSRLRTSRSCTYLTSYPFASALSQQARATSTTSPYFANTHIKPNSPALATPKQKHTKMRPSPQTMLIRFYDPEIKAKDDKGRTLDDILSWNDATLEHSHDYIQTLFPLPEPSGARDNAPLITPEVQQAFLTRPELRKNLIDAFKRMLSFYGLEYGKIQDTDVEYAVKQGPNWSSALSNWVVRRDHNHLRITRTIRSLRVLGCNKEAYAFHSFLEQDKTVLGSVSQQSRDFWARAYNSKIWLPPNELDETAVGTAWLRPDHGEDDE